MERLEERALLTTAVQFYDQVSQIVLDTAGNSYVIGQFSNTVDLGIDPSGNHVTMTDTNPNMQTVNPPNWPAGIGTDGFVAKYDPNGNILWAHDTCTLTNGDYFASQLAVSGNTVYVLSGSFDSMGDGYQTSSLRQFTLTALNATTGTVSWSHHTPGDGYESIAADSNGVYLTSWFGSNSNKNVQVDFNPTTPARPAR